MEDVIKVIDEICNDEIIKVVISNKKNKEFKYNKVGIQLKEKNKKEYYQIEKFTDKQVFHENIKIDEIPIVSFDIEGQHIGVSLLSKQKSPHRRAFHFTHCESGYTGIFGNAVFEPVVLS